MRQGAMSAIRSFILPVAAMMLSACANQQLGPVAQYVSDEDRANPPLEVSASFRSDLCSPLVGYLAISVRNPSSEWKTLSNVRLGYPYSSDGFRAIRGEELLAWADARSQQTRRDAHNAALARLAVASVGRLMMDSDNDNTSAAGAALVTGTILTDVAGNIEASRTAAEMPAGNRSNHLFSDELIIPPRMDRTFWILIGAAPDAPLMGWAGILYQDENQKQHQLVTPIAAWQSCQWQHDRIQFLKDWSSDQEPGTRTVTTRNSRISPRTVYEVNWIRVEKQYQAQQTLSASQ